MKKTSFVIAILASALLAGACGGKKDAAKTTPPAGDMGSGSAMGSGDGMAPAAGSGSSM